jgi:hypothetical protein
MCQFRDVTLLTGTAIFTVFASLSAMPDKLLVAMSSMEPSSYYRVHSSPPLYDIVSQLNPLHMLKTFCNYKN